jgi:N-hydroxyarylamine O-acetyltransferase
MNIDELLSKIGCVDCKEVNMDNLKKLMVNNTLVFPFDNLDMHLGKHVDLSLEVIYEKMVKGKRGGYCLELNLLFSWVLKQLGYNVQLAEANLYVHEMGRFYKRTVHLILIVELDSKLYYVDVATSGPLNEPLEINLDIIQKKASGTYRFRMWEQQPGYYLLEGSKNDLEIHEWRSLMTFKLEYKNIEDFYEMNEYVQGEGHTFLYYRSLVTKHLPGNKMIIMHGYKFSQIEFSESGETRKDEIIENDEQVKKIIKEIFDVECDFDKLKIKQDEIIIE